MDLETSPTLEFEFFLAATLGRTVDELRRTMSGEEFTYWGIYYARKAQRKELALKSTSGGG